MKIEILIIDDHERTAVRLTQLLNKLERFNVRCCNFDHSNIRKEIKQIIPDIILLDTYDMETANKFKGLELTETSGNVWRSDGVKAIILLTVFDKDNAGEVSTQIKKSLANGMFDGYIQKPASVSEIVNTIQNTLKKVRSEQ